MDGGEFGNRHSGVYIAVFCCARAGVLTLLAALFFTQTRALIGEILTRRSPGNKFASASR